MPDEINTNKKIRILKELTPADVILSMQFEKPEFIIDELIATGLVLVCGKPKVGKSWFMLRMCVDIAAGNKFLSKFAVKPSKVAYFALEDNGSRLQDRLIEMEAEVNLYNILIANQLRVFDDVGLKCFEDFIASNPEIRVYIIDTMQKIKPTTRSKNTNDYEADYPFASKLQSLALQYNVVIVLVHHGRKNNTSDEFTDDVLGSTGITAAADIIIMLRRIKDEKHTSQLQIAGRDVERRTLSYAIDPGSMKFTVVDDDGGAIKQQLTVLQSQIISLLEINSGKEYGATEIVNLLGKTGGDSARSSVSKSLKRLFSRGIIQSASFGKYHIGVIQQKEDRHAGHGAEKTEDFPGLEAMSMSVTNDKELDTVNTVNGVSVSTVSFTQNNKTRTKTQAVPGVEPNVSPVTTNYNDNIIIGRIYDKL
jgi:hypothetical protein